MRTAPLGFLSRPRAPPSYTSEVGGRVSALIRDLAEALAEDQGTRLAEASATMWMLCGEEATAKDAVRDLGGIPVLVRVLAEGPDDLADDDINPQDDDDDDDDDDDESSLTRSDTTKSDDDDDDDDPGMMMKGNLQRRAKLDGGGLNELKDVSGSSSAGLLDDVRRPFNRGGEQETQQPPEDKRADSQVGLLVLDDDRRRGPSAKASAALALTRLGGRNEANKVAIAAAGGIAVLVDVLNDVPRTTSDAAKREACGALWTVAKNANNKVAIASVGGILPIVKLAAATADAVTMMYAGGALRNLSCNNDENKVAIVKCGGVETLVSIVKNCDDDRSREEAAAALGNISRMASDDHRRAVAAAGAIPPLVSCLEVATTVDGCRAAAAGALAILACDDDNAAKVAADGGVLALVRLASSAKASEKAREEAAVALRNLTCRSGTAKGDYAASFYDDNDNYCSGGHPQQQRTGSSGGSFESSSSSFSSGSGSGSGSGGGSRSPRSPSSRRSLSSSRLDVDLASGIAHLVAVLKFSRNSDRARASSAVALSNLTPPGCDANATALVAAGGIDPLVRFAAEARSPDAVYEAVATLRNMTAHVIAWEPLRASGAFPVLVARLAGADAGIVDNAACAIANLLNALENHAALRDARGLAPLLRLARGHAPSYDAVEHATRALQLLIGGGQCDDALADLDDFHEQDWQDDQDDQDQDDDQDDDDESQRRRRRFRRGSSLLSDTSREDGRRRRRRLGRELTEEGAEGGLLLRKRKRLECVKEVVSSVRDGLRGDVRGLRVRVFVSAGSGGGQGTARRDDRHGGLVRAGQRVARVVRLDAVRGGPLRRRDHAARTRTGPRRGVGRRRRRRRDVPHGRGGALWGGGDGRALGPERRRPGPRLSLRLRRPGGPGPRGKKRPRHGLLEHLHRDRRRHRSCRLRGRPQEARLPRRLRRPGPLHRRLRHRPLRRPRH